MAFAASVELHPHSFKKKVNNIRLRSSILRSSKAKSLSNSCTSQRIHVFTSHLMTSRMHEISKHKQIVAFYVVMHNSKAIGMRSFKSKNRNKFLTTRKMRHFSSLKRMPNPFLRDWFLPRKNHHVKAGSKYCCTTTFLRFAHFPFL